MKISLGLALWAMVPAVLTAASTSLRSKSAVAQRTGDRTITKVVHILEDMLESSKKDGDADKGVFAKFKCYCNTKKTAKTTSIEALTREISMLESKIEAIRGSTGALSTSNAQVKTDMEANEQARKDAEALRAKEKEAFETEKADLEVASKQMAAAIEMLGAVGADQTLSSGADHAQEMAGFTGASLLDVSSSIKQAYAMGSEVLDDAQAQTMDSFLQALNTQDAPYTGTYTAQSGEVVGILKNMKDTFKQNLASAVSQEKVAAEAYTSFMSAKKASYDELSALFEKQEGDMGSNDGDLAGKQEQLTQAKKQKVLDEEFLDQLIPMCQEKAKEFASRKALRTNEDAAITEAISILNSDAAFGTFGEVTATKSGATGPESFLQVQSIATGFLQVRSLQNSRQKVNIPAAKRLLKKALAKAGSLHDSLNLMRLYRMLMKENPFNAVIAGAQKMLQVIQAEEAADQEKIAHCKSEKEANDAAISDKTKQIVALNSAIEALTTDIEDPESGLQAQVEETEASLKDNFASQKESTVTRKTANLIYQKSIANLVQADELISSAIKVLKKYYAQLEGQAENKAPEAIQGSSAPKTWEGEKGFQGQNSDGNSAITMLEFILEETRKEEVEGHSDEKRAQHEFEDCMATLKSQEATLQKSLVELKKTLSEKLLDLSEKKEALAATETDKVAVENYMAKIKRGCDFFQVNYEDRKARRKEETSAVENLIKTLKDTAYYKVEAARESQNGYKEAGCGTECAEDPDHAKCQACVEKVSVRGYCVTHPQATGCESS